MSYELTEVDGVPTLFARHDGPMIAGLTFRAGQADETLATRGITHLLEHLALHGHGLTDYHYNGRTAAITTTFHMQGGEDDIVAFLNGVCASLQALPLHRLETERQVLSAEEGGRGGGPAESLALWRYGARGYGLPAYPEMGLPRLTGDDLLRWAQAWFTRQNAVLWVAGERIPASLKLALADGARMAPPAATSTLPRTPAYFVGDDPIVAYDGVVRRGVAGSSLAGVLERELHRSLRREDGNCYTAATNYEARGDGYAVITALADSVPGKHDAVLGGFVDVLAKLQAGRIAPEDLAAVKAMAEDTLHGPMAEVGRLPLRAVDLLTGTPLRTNEEIRADLQALTLDGLHEAAREMLGSGLLCVPPGHDAEWAGFEPAPTASDGPIGGERYQSRHDKRVTLVVGPAGVGLEREDSPPVAIPFQACAVSLAYPDGGRTLIGFDSLTVRVEPTIYPVPPEVLARIDAALGPVTVPRPPRDPDQIPQPKPAGAPAASGPSGGSGERTGLLVGGVIALVLSVVALCCSGIWSAVVADNSDPETDVPLDATSLGINIVGYAAAVGLAILGVVLLRRRNRK